MNGRGDTFGVCLPRQLLATTPGGTDVERGDDVFVVPDPDDRNPSELRVYLSGDAVSVADMWSAWDDRGDRRRVTYMNGRQDTVGISLPCDYVRAFGGEYDATLAPHSREVVSVFLPAESTVRGVAGD